MATTAARAMQVTVISERFAEIRQGARSWTLRRYGFGGQLIINNRGTVVLTSGPTGQRILRAVKRHTRREPIQHCQHAPSSNPSDQGGRTKR